MEIPPSPTTTVRSEGTISIDSGVNGMDNRQPVGPQPRPPVPDRDLHHLIEEDVEAEGTTGIAGATQEIAAEGVVHLKIDTVIAEADQDRVHQGVTEDVPCLPHPQVRRFQFHDRFCQFQRSRRTSWPRGCRWDSRRPRLRS